MTRSLSTFWHVYGEQSGSPMDALVQEFNRTVGQDTGVRVRVTNLSSAAEIGGFLKEAQKRRRPAQICPTCSPATSADAAALGEDNLVDWRDWFTEEELSDFVPGFLADGTSGGRQAAALPDLQIHPAFHVQRQRLSTAFPQACRREI